MGTREKGRNLLSLRPLCSPPAALSSRFGISSGRAVSEPARPYSMVAVAVAVVGWNEDFLLQRLHLSYTKHPLLPFLPFSSSLFLRQALLLNSLGWLQVLHLFVLGSQLHHHTPFFSCNSWVMWMRAQTESSYEFILLFAFVFYIFKTLRMGLERH